MSSSPVRIVIVDTNCFLRLYQSPVLPFLGQEVGGFRLLTLECLVAEFLESPTLIKNYPCVASGPKNIDLKNAQLKSRSATKASIQNAEKELRPYAKSLLELYCKNRNITPAKNLSRCDIELLATVISVRGMLATDEWPLRTVAYDLLEDPNEYNIGVLSSLDLLHLLEVNGKLTPEDRRTTVDSWVRYKENLLKGWQADYQRLFGESAELLGKD